MFHSLFRTLALFAVTLALPIPSAAKLPHDQEAPRVGVQAKVETLSQRDADAIAQAGFGFVRFGIWTNLVDDPVYMRRVASAFRAAAHARLPVLLTMRSTAPLTDPGDSSDARLMAEGRRFGMQVTAIARQYASQLVGIELWNEPDLDRYWPTGDVATTFPVFMQGVCGELAAASRQTRIFGFGFSRAPVGANAASSLLRSALSASPHCIDAVSYHAYGMTPSQIRDVAREVREKYAMPALITEWGVPSQGSAARNPAAQASGIASFIASLRGLDVPLVSIYEWKDTASARTARERSFGLVDATGAEKPALDRIRAYFAADSGSRGR
ncbi:cellulase family glycosylhydrolase [Caballeronia sp. Lep1P3]|uniref:cellulase family glycosylhydrolase n=1 Tax=Caballeronia sp. Lep1P3 TaxID=2878150 RepID=UPI001FD39DC7|nr:cellulase family glycosylhydrolase [Caballeronia sp. Lep1P3]